MRKRNMTLLLTAAMGCLLWVGAPAPAGSDRGYIEVGYRGQAGRHDDEHRDSYRRHSTHGYRDHDEYSDRRSDHGRKHKAQHKHHHDEYSDRRHSRYGYDRFVVPRHLQGRIVHDYRQYHHGSEYFKPHRHHHETYYFPVVTEFGYRYRPHSYCGGELYLAGSRLSLHLNF